MNRSSVEREVQNYMRCTRALRRTCDPETYIEGLEEALEERLRVNVGLRVENAELRGRVDSPS